MAATSEAMITGPILSSYSPTDLLAIDLLRCIYTKNPYHSIPKDDGPNIMLMIATVAGDIGPLVLKSRCLWVVSAVSAADVPANATAMLAHAKKVRSLANHALGSSLRGIRRGRRLRSISPPPPLDGATSAAHIHKLITIRCCTRFEAVRMCNVKEDAYAYLAEGMAP